jgi:aspartyl-tRNA(Asn)/glutamyl-tRNA(Gln) amidotransferase subunit A
MELKGLTIAGVKKALESGETTAATLAEQTLAYAQRENRRNNAFLTFAPERALQQARRIDQLLAAGHPLPPLGGVPLAVKDVIVTGGLRTTCGSRILANYIPPYDATAVRKLEEAGAVIVGKTNCDEFAMGSSTENSAFGLVRNPHDLDRVPGGSSGGSAAAVAADMCVVALGSDTGGSIRQPASFCGVVGLMGTYGRVSRYGLVAFASSLDHIGPIAKSVRDAAAVLGVIAGRDPSDSTSADVPVPGYLAELDRPKARQLRGFRVGVPREYFGAGLDPQVGGRVQQGIERLRELGAEIRDIRLPHTDYAIACYYIICTAEASSNLARYDGVRYGLRSPRCPSLPLVDCYRATRGEGFGAEVKRRIMLGAYALSAGYYEAYYLKAQKVRALVAKDFSEAFGEVDVIVTPVAPTPAFRLGEKTDDPLEMYLSDIYTITASLAGIPGISVPCGCNASGLPIGMQILARHFNEPAMLRAAQAFELSGGANATAPFRSVA